MNDLNGPNRPASSVGRAGGQQSNIKRYLPSRRTAAGIPAELARFDIIAGMTTGAVVMPKAMAMAAVAGLPVELGLYTALLPMAIYALFGSSQRLSMSTTATIGILTGAALAEMGRQMSTEQMVAATVTLSLIVGAVLLISSFLKFGALANSYSILSSPVSSWVSGLSSWPIKYQTLGIHIQKVGFGRDLVSLWRHLPETYAHARRGRLDIGFGLRGGTFPAALPGSFVCGGEESSPPRSSDRRKPASRLWAQCRRAFRRFTCSASPASMNCGRRRSVSR